MLFWSKSLLLALTQLIFNPKWKCLDLSILFSIFEYHNPPMDRFTEWRPQVMTTGWRIVPRWPPVDLFNLSLPGLISLACWQTDWKPARAGLSSLPASFPFPVVDPLQSSRFFFGEDLCLQEITLLTSLNLQSHCSPRKPLSFLYIEGALWIPEQGRCSTHAS